MRVGSWREALASLQPTLVDGRWRVDAHPGLSIDVLPKGRDDVDLRISMPLSESIGAMHIVCAAHALSESGRIETGDAELDRLAWLFTSEVATLGALSAHTRRLLRELLEHGATFESGSPGEAGAIVLEPWACAELAAADDAPSAIAGVVQDMVRLAQALVVPKGEQPFVRIGKIAHTDPDPAVRLAFARIVKRFPEVQSANARLIAKRANVADDATFEALAELVRAEGTSNQVLREAWKKLLTLFPNERVAPLLLEVAKKATADMLVGLIVARTADVTDRDVLRPYGHSLLALIGARGKPEHSAAIEIAQFFQRAKFLPGIPWLGKSLARSESVQLRREALGALLVMPSPAEETIASMSEGGHEWAVGVGGGVAHYVASQKHRLGPLVAALLEETQPLIHNISEYLIALRINGDPAFAELIVPHLESETDFVRDSAIEALGDIGSLAHVRLLTPLTRGFFRSNAVKEAALAAIEKIQQRAPHASEGGLTLAQGDEGGLAIAEGGDER